MAKNARNLFGDLPEDAKERARLKAESILLSNQLQDERARKAVLEGHLYNAACNAALLAAEIGSGKERALLIEGALDYLREEQVRWREMLDAAAAGDDPEAEAKLRDVHSRHAEHARVRDPDLEILRTTPAFRELYPAPEAATQEAGPAK